MFAKFFQYLVTGCFFILAALLKNAFLKARGYEEGDIYEWLTLSNIPKVKLRFYF